MERLQKINARQRYFTLSLGFTDDGRVSPRAPAPLVPIPGAFVSTPVETSGKYESSAWDAAVSFFGVCALAVLNQTTATQMMATRMEVVAQATRKRVMMLTMAELAAMPTFHERPSTPDLNDVV